jgi:hypothetical protein
VGDKVSGSIHSRVSRADGGAAEVQENTFSDDRQQACIVTSWSAPGCDSARLSSGNIGRQFKGLAWEVGTEVEVPFKLPD